MKKIVIGVILLILVVVIGFCTFRRPVSRDISRTALRYEEAKLGEISIMLHEVGEIQPLREVEIKSRISGKVVSFFVNEGDYVERGDLIAEIEPDFNQASQIANIRNNIHLTKIRLQNAEKEYERRQELFDQNFIAKSEVDNAVDELGIARINYQSALQQYELIQEIDTDGNVSRIVSTGSGTVLEKKVEEGEMVVSSTSSFSDGTVIVRLADLKNLVVNAFINEVDISKVALGQKARIQVDAYPTRQFNGVIENIGTLAITRNNVKVFPIEVRIAEQDTPLRPGMTANVTIYGESKDNIVIIPISAVFSDDDDNDIVYKVKNDSLATVGTPIRTGINDFNFVEIIDGVTKGDKVSLVEP